MSLMGFITINVNSADIFFNYGYVFVIFSVVISNWELCTHNTHQHIHIHLAQ